MTTTDPRIWLQATTIHSGELLATRAFYAMGPDVGNGHQLLDQAHNTPADWLRIVSDLYGTPCLMERRS